MTTKTYTGVTPAMFENLKNEVESAGGSVVATTPTAGEIQLRGLAATYDHTGPTLTIVLVHKSGFAKLLSDETVFEKIREYGGLTEA